MAAQEQPNDQVYEPMITIVTDQSSLGRRIEKYDTDDNQRGLDPDREEATHQPAGDVSDKVLSGSFLYFSITTVTPPEQV